uniref:alpha-1,2-Mannosidase n=1 Tax=Globodera rostochiensis TaxID=31243 RepID=A0A914ICH1_GLORO
MGLRFYEKYLLLFGVFVASCFLLSGTFVYFRSNNANQIRTAEAENRNDNPKLRIVHDSIKRIEVKTGLSSQNVSTKDIEHRRNFTREMMKFAWSNYARYAWGENELRPITKIGHSGSVFGRAPLGATIIDALDTLLIMGLNEEFELARDWVAKKFNMKESQSDLSVFETNIRFVGGLLSAFALTKEKVFLDKAREVADLLLPAFDASPFGIPMALVNLKTGRTGNYGWASGGCSILSELGSLELEFNYLSRLTGNQTYVSKCARVREYVTELRKPDGLYPNYINPQTGKWCQKHVSVGALGDSFYENLLKIWIFNGKRDDHLREAYQSAIKAIEEKLLLKSATNHLWYFAEMKGNRIEQKMDHLACFIAGMLALQSLQEHDESTRAHFLQLAEQIGNTCHESYRKTVTGIGPESFHFSPDAEAQATRISESYYILRPEAIEGWFYLWRVTGNEKYREWCWEAAQAIERHCRVEAGYSGIRNVNTERVEHDDVQQSFFLAETLKYLFLAFSDSTEMPLDQWVFNTEAHTFPIVHATQQI